MRAGPLKYYLTLMKPAYSTDRMGAQTVTYEETVTVHAERVNMSGKRSEEVGEHFADYTTRFNIRDAHEVDDGWRVQQRGGHLYTVVAIEPNLDRGFNTLICERVNE